MEKRLSTTKRIVLTGPESTAKSVLTKQLATHFNAPCIAEYARDYVNRLSRDYNFHDVETITCRQLALEKLKCQKQPPLLFIDTQLIILKYWFLEVYEKLPDWFPEMYLQFQADFYLLCYPDLEWQPDPTRENGGERRNYLYNCYKSELDNLNLPYAIIKGENYQRIQNAIDSVTNYFF